MNGPDGKKLTEKQLARLLRKSTSSQQRRQQNIKTILRAARAQKRTGGRAK